MLHVITSISRADSMVIGMDWFLFGAVMLLLVTLGAFVFYYKRLRGLVEAQEEAKNLVGDIIVSFNKQAERQEEKLDAALRKTLAFTSKNSGIEGRLETQETQITQISKNISELSLQQQEMQSHLNNLDQKVTQIVTAQEALLERLAGVEEKTQRATLSESNIEAVIPIRQEKALAPLTPTELAVLETLANEGEKTAPEIKAKINLTREHTARLMKKLYEAGYLERTTNKIPFAYRIKEEMRKFLKKTEVKA